MFARYVEPADAERAVALGIKRIVGGLDPYSYYLSAQERGEARQSLVRGGESGLTLRLVHTAGGSNHLEVVGVRKDSSAGRQAMRIGDHVLRIGRVSARDFLNQAGVELALRGQPGERRQLWVQRSEQAGPEWIELELARVTRREEVTARLVQDDSRSYLLLTIRSFRSGTGERVADLRAEYLRRRENRRFDGIILDLRGNPGGEVDEALVVADQFLATGVLTRTRGRGGRVLREERAHPAGTDEETPLVVVQDRYTASVAELLSVALQDHGRAVVVGERSYGKGTVQDVIGMEDGSVLTLTIARYFSPHDRMIDKNGVPPDVPVGGGGVSARRRQLETAVRQLRMVQSP
ncbi:MAG: S41 family peptidase [Nannocystaceae bacterium]